MSDAEAETTFAHPLGRHRRRAGVLALRLADGLRVPPPVRCAALALQGLRQGFLASPRARCSPRHKLPLRGYLAAIAIFCNEVKGKSMLALSPRSRPVLQVGVRAGAQAARGDGRGNEGPPDRRRSPRGRGRRCLLRRLREARQPEGGSRRPPPGQEPIRQAQGRGRDPRARRRDAAGRVQVRRPSRCPGSSAASSRAPSCTPTKRRPGTTCTRASR